MNRVVKMTLLSIACTVAAAAGCSSGTGGTGGAGGAGGSAGSGGTAGSGGSGGSGGAGGTGGAGGAGGAGGGIATDCTDAGPMEIDIARYHPEGVAIAADGTAYIGSVTTGQVVTFADCSGAPTTFIASGGAVVGAVGLLVDATNDVLWVCSSDFATGANPTVHGYDRTTGALTASHPLPGTGGFCNDMALDSAGNLLVTESFGGGIFRVAAGALLSDNDAVSWFDDAAFDVAAGQFGLNGITVIADAVYTVNYQTGDLYRVDMDGTGAATGLTTITLDRALVNPDGLKALDADTLLVVEGGSATLSTVDITGDTGAVTEVTSTLDSPTTVAVFGNQAWVVEGQFDHLLGYDPNPAELPFVAVRVPLP